MTNKKELIDSLNLGKNPCGCEVAILDEKKCLITIKACDVHIPILEENMYKHVSISFNADKEFQVDK